ncbi:UPF0272 protein [Endomicrobiia bacterium]|nr:UPF0272 protein [Endomicrobiia bacterium]
MKTLHLDCSMGAAGDMITAALFELIDNKQDFLKQINSLGFSDVEVNAEPAVKCGIVGTRIKVKICGMEETSTDRDILCNNYKQFCNPPRKYNHIHERSHANPKKIEDIISNLNIPQKVRDNALNIYHLIAKAEAAAHGKPIDQIHFHEVGNSDAITDIVGVCMLMNFINPEEVVVSPINVGSGFVGCAHGILPVPTPATAFILKNTPFYGSNIQGELCTPTGAAIVKHFATSFNQMPTMYVQKIGYGMGVKDFETANYVRAFLGETKDTGDESNEQIAQLQCNLDDMTGEAIGFAVDLLLEKGALDVFTTPIQMKKNRPAVLLTCISGKDKADFLAGLILQHTSSFGVRKSICYRYTLNRTTSVCETPYGKIRIKIGKGYNVTKSKPEYDDIEKAAHLNNVSFDEVKKHCK